MRAVLGSQALLLGALAQLTAHKYVAVRILGFIVYTEAAVLAYQGSTETDSKHLDFWAFLGILGVCVMLGGSMAYKHMKKASSARAGVTVVLLGLYLGLTLS